MSKGKIQLIVLLFLFLSIVQTLYLQYRVADTLKGAHSSDVPTAMASGTASLCINNPPILNNTCNLTTQWGSFYECVVSGYDIDVNSTLTFSSTFIDHPNIFNVTANGTISMTPQASDYGNHTVRIFVRDNSGCSNAMNFEDFNVEIFWGNHAPYLIRPIPNKSIARYTSFSFYLNDYFSDPDNDTLNYTLIPTAVENITLTISDAGFVNIRADTCGQALFAFLAEDPSGLTNTSNTVVYTITGCQISNPDDNRGGGGGGGGGSGISSNCIPEWRCGRYAACSPNGTSELRCTDIQGCDRNDYIRFFYKNCTYVPPVYYCQEDWNCTEWSTCVNAAHTRTCKDRNSCGTSKTKPNENEQCEALPSCFNGIQDGDETAIDCGGTCGRCAEIQKPAVIEQKSNTAVIAAAALTVVFIAAILFTFRKNIQKMFASLRHHKQLKPIYIGDDKKKRLIELQYVMQQRYEEKKYDALATELPLFIQQYFKELLGVIPTNKAEISKLLGQLKNKQIEPLLIDYYDAYHKFKEEKQNIKLQAILDEMLAFIFLICELTDKDALILDKERVAETKDNLETCYQYLSNIYIAIEFGENIAAKNLYNDLLQKYASLSPQEKKDVYGQLMRTYNLMNYVLRY